MKFKKGDKVRFIKDCQLYITENVLGEIILANSEWIVEYVSEKSYGIQSMDEKVHAIVPASDVHNHCKLIKASKDKHNILADLIQTDGSVDGEKLMEKLAKSDEVNHPSHYTDGKIEVIDYIEDKKLTYHLGNACKYISRAGKKQSTDRATDIRKAIWYLNRQLEVWERE